MKPSNFAPESGAAFGLIPDSRKHSPQLISDTLALGGIKIGTVAELVNGCDFSLAHSWRRVGSDRTFYDPENSHVRRWFQPRRRARVLRSVFGGNSHIHSANVLKSLRDVL